MWAQEAIWYAKKGASSVNLRFKEDHLWNDWTMAEIENSLRFDRLIKARGNYTPFPIAFEEVSSTEQAFVLEEVSSEVWRLLSFTKARSQADGIQLQLSVRESEIQIRIERYMWRLVSAKSSQVSDLLDATLYLLIGLWNQLGFTNHAEIAAMRCLEYQSKSPNRELAFVASNTLINRPIEAVELALLNDLHVYSDVNMSLFAAALVNSLARFDQLSQALEKFVRTALEHSKDEKPNSALQYNLAKFYRNAKQWARSARAYNNLRKTDTSYLKRSYFWHELGSVFYSARKYTMAAICYENLCRIESLPLTHTLLGDAYFYGNKILKAKSEYEKAKQDHTSVGAEAELKYSLILWLEKLGKKESASLTDHDWLLSTREEALKENRFDDAFWSHLGLTFLDVDDIACWTDAIFLSLVQKNIPNWQDVLRCALKFHGLKPFSRFKIERVEFINGLGELNEEMNRIVIDILNSTQEENDYEPGNSIDEFQKLQEEGVLRIKPLF